VHRDTGSFAVAGAASAAFGLANVLAAPLRARAIDLWGQRRALTPLGLAQAAVFSGFALVAQSKATSDLSFVVFSGAAGLLAPPLGASMRSIWTALTEAGAQRTRALSLDATADEVVFIIGPVVAALLSTTFSPSTALLASAIATLTGTVGITTSRASGSLRGAPPVRERSEGPLRRPGFVRALVVLVGVGIVLGTIEIAAPAVATASHHSAAAGWLLAALSGGSAIGGLVYGHVAWRGDLGSRMLALAAAMGALTCCVGLVGNVAVFAVGLVLIGLFIAPSIITGYLAAERLVPHHALTEASVWTNTALNLGAAIANATAGALIAGAGVTWAMLLAGVLAIGAAAYAPRDALRTSTTELPSTPP
jgi:MFS family permease